MLANKTMTAAAGAAIAVALAGFIWAGLLGDRPQPRPTEPNVAGRPGFPPNVPGTPKSAPNVIGTPKSVPTVRIDPLPSTDAPASFDGDVLHTYQPQPRPTAKVVGAPNSLPDAPGTPKSVPNVIGPPKSVRTIRIDPLPSAETPSSSAATTAKPACPSQDFAEFVDAFAESADVQKQRTRIPLVYGRMNAELLGTAREDEAFSRRRIKSFEKIPLLDPDDGGRIFFSKVKRTKNRLEMQIGATSDEPERATTAIVFLPDTGFRLIYRFIKTEDCFTLIGIDDPST